LANQGQGASIRQQQEVSKREARAQGIPLVLALNDPSAQLLQVGGKGASLARMAAADLSVPPGFHITTVAYRRFVTENGLQEQILAAVSAVTALIILLRSKRHQGR